MVLFHYMICLNCSKHILENRAECRFPYCKIHFRRLACKLSPLEINLDKLFCSGEQRGRTITVGLHFLPQGNFQNNSQVKPRLSCLGCCCLFVRSFLFQPLSLWMRKRTRIGMEQGAGVTEKMINLFITGRNQCFLWHRQASVTNLCTNSGKTEERPWEKLAEQLLSKSGPYPTEIIQVSISIKVFTSIKSVLHDILCSIEVS